MKQLFSTFLTMAVLVMSTLVASAQQLPDSGFEDWSGDAFNGDPQLKNWHASNVEQVGLKFNFEHRETGRSGKYCVMVQDQEVGAMGITENSPGYVSLGQPWQYLPGITQVSQATAGTAGSINFTYRPDSMVIWIKRTGNNWSKEDFHLLFYSWKGTAQGSKYKNKNNGCTNYSRTDEESDIRLALDGNECGTDTKVTQVAEGWLRDRKEYTNWTRISVPIYYLSDETPQKCNVILSASNYPNFRANSGLYVGNSLYADDIELIYSSKIQQLYIGGKVWNGFDPNSTEEQVYSVGQTTVVPEVYAVRGVGALTNTKGTTVNFPGRRLSGDEISIKYGQVDGTPTVITVKSGDGSSTTTYKIKMVQEKSSNAKLNSVMVNGTPLSGFNPMVSTYNVELPYGTTAVPEVTFVKAEDDQVVTVTQATSVTGKATIVVTAPDGQAKMTYTLSFSIAKLSDNTLEGIKINGTLLADFSPSQTTYRVELPIGTTAMPTVEAVSAYPAGEQTIVYTAPDKVDGGQYKISVTTPGNSIARVYKLNFVITASSNSKLADLQMDYLVGFNPNTTVYYVNLPLGTTQVPAITYTAGDAEQKVEIEYGTVDGKTTVTVTAGNGNKTVYQIFCSVAKSENTLLNNIYIDNQALEGFAPNTYHYTVDLPVGTTAIPVVTYDQGDEFQTVEVNYGGVNATTRIFVTAGNGSTALYEIYFSVPLADVATLNMITVGGEPLVGFAPEQTDYTIALPQGTSQLPEIGVEQHDEWQIVTIRLGDVNGDTKITVRSQAGTQTIYILHFSVATSSNTTLKGIEVDGVPYEEFDPAQLSYEIQLPAGVSKVPELTPLPGEASQKLVTTLEGAVWTVRVIAESGAQTTYEFRFIIQKSENAFLNNIYIGDRNHPLEGFRKDSNEYTVVLTTLESPAILVDKDPTQHVTVTAPASTGVATIVVTPEAGAPFTYYITFTSTVLPQLTAIKADGVLLDGFAPTTYTYSIEYSGEQPVITYEKESEAQKVVAVADAEGVRLYVEAGGVQKVYEVTFVQMFASDATLRSIKADGVQLADFAPATLSYTLPMPADGVMPVITYELSDPSQHVVAGQSAQYDYSLVVMAESGAAQTYTIHFTPNASSETAVVITLGGEPVAFDDNYTSAQLVEPGRELPVIGYTKRDDQTVVAAQTAELQQQVIVVAEDGTTQTYTINYTRTSIVNALLKNIRIRLDDKWKDLDDFDENTTSYNLTLPLGTKVAPCVWPVAGKPGQVITVTYGAANGATTIHVEASNGEEQTYTINFAVEKSSNNKLAELTIDGAPYPVDQTDIEIEVPFGTTELYPVAYKKAEDSQLVEFISAPITGTTKIIVTAENGNERTYSIAYKIAEPQGENKLLSIAYAYKNAAGVTVSGTLDAPKAGNDTINLPYGATEFTVKGFEKNYPEQTVVSYDGGIRRGATLIVCANRSNTPDVTYTLVPVMPEFEPQGKLSDLRFKNVTIPNFKPYVYNYIIKVTAEPTLANFTYKAYNNATVTRSAIDKTKKQITFEVDGGETYSVCWYYENDGKYLKNGKYYDYLDFSQEWEPTTSAAMWTSSWTSSASATGTMKSTGFKPHGWTVPADKVAGLEYDISVFGTHVVDLFWYTGKEVIASGSNGAMLSTINGASINGSMPGMMTLGGTMTVTPGKSGGSTSSITYNTANFITMRNTPDSLSMRYKALAASNVSGWSFVLKTVAGNTTRTDGPFNGNYNSSEWGYASMPIKAYTGVMSKYALTINSAHTENAGDMTGSNTIYTSDLLIENVHFVYNSDLTSATVNGNPTSRSGNTFTYTLADDEVIVGMPALKFTGKVHDQMQIIRWQNNGEWINGELIAKVTNFGENVVDSTVYTVVLKRAAETSLSYSRNAFKSPAGEKYPTTTIGDTVYVDMPFGTKAVPDLNIKPNSTHQRFALTKLNREVKVTVTNEQNESRDTVYIFREVATGDASLVNLTAAGSAGLKQKDNPTQGFHPDVTDYTVSAEVMPELTFKKILAEDGVTDLGQTVDLKYNEAGATVTVTTAYGVSKTYNVSFTQLLPATYGALAMITRDNERLDGFVETTTEYTKPFSENVGFERKQNQENDLVTQTVTDRYVSIAVKGTEDAEAKAYTITYPTEKSSNANLADVLVNGESYKPFNPLSTQIPTFETDEQADVKFILAEDVQTMEITIGTDAAGAPRKVAARAAATVFTVKITAENGDTKTYTFAIRPESSDINTLNAIYVAGELLENFYPEKTDYTYVIPSATPKTTEPVIPEVTYELGQESQTVEIEPAARLGDITRILVTPENGKPLEQREYHITFTAEPSHNAELKNILVNGKEVAGFQPARVYYSMQVVGTEGEQLKLDYTLGDPFQTVEVTDIDSDDADKMGKQLLVTAQDGISTRSYVVEIWRGAKSNNANLADILLGTDGSNKPMAEYAADHGIEDLVFEPKNYRYTIPVTRADTLPDIAVRLQEDAQTVVIIPSETPNGTLDTIRVTAEDGTVNDYYLLFALEKSSNTGLAMIFLSGDSLKNFEPNTLEYRIALPIGERKVPAVDAIKSESVQTLVAGTSDDGMQTSFLVTAEDGTQVTYKVTFDFTYSEADTLKGIYAGGELIDGYRPDSGYYAFTLPMGARTLPYLDFEPGDRYQLQQRIDTIAETYRTTYQCRVTAEDSVHTRTYTVIYEIQPSDIDTLKSLYLVTGESQRPLKGFNPHVLTYTDTLAKGITTLPSVMYVTGDDYQTVDTVINNSNRTIMVKVTAENKQSRTYTVYFVTERSSEAALMDINIAGMEWDGFNPLDSVYTITLPFGSTTVPNVLYTKAEPEQNVTLTIRNMQVVLDVVAEDGVTTFTYTLNFVVGKSSEAHLASIAIGDEELADFTADNTMYTISLPYGTTELPGADDVTAVPLDSAATVSIVVEGSIITIEVTAADSITTFDYTIAFEVEQCSINWLEDISINGQTIEGFDKDTLIYSLVHPVGSDSTAFVHAEDIQYELADTTETVVVSESDGIITIQVIAQNQKDVRFYFITQTILINNNSLLSDLTINGQTVAGFNDSIFEYSYILIEGEVPTVEAQAQDSLAEVSITQSSGGDVFVYCTAQDGSESVYVVHFVISPINEALNPTSNDVLFKQLPGSDQFAVYTIRMNTWFALYDHYGHIYMNLMLPLCNPNQVDVASDPSGREILTDAHGQGTVFTIPAHGQTFFYLFYSDNKRISSGKFMVQ